MKINNKKLQGIDELDLKIFQELQINGRQSYLNISKKLHSSEGTIRNRVRVGSKKEIIKIKAVVDPTKLEFNFSCVMGFEIAINKLREAASMLAECPNVYFLTRCTGSFDIIAVLIFRNTQELDKFVEETCSKLPGIERTQTFVTTTIIKTPWINDTGIIKLIES